MPYAVLLKEAHRLIDEMPEEKLMYIVKIIQQDEKKVTAEEANAFLDKYGDISVGTSEASVLAMREALKNDVW